MSWFATCYRQGFTNLGGPRLRQFDGHAFVRRWKDAGAELVYLDAIHQNETLFPTRISRQAPLLEGRDLVGEFVQACKAHGVRAGAYITPFEHTPLSENHPEYSQTGTDGTRVDHDGYRFPDGRPIPYWSCWNSPFLDGMCALIAELFGHYDLDAAFFDGLVSRHGVCHCPACAEKFKHDTGHDLPGAHDRADPVFRAYRAWKDGTLTDACRRIVAATRVRNPAVQVVSNTPAAWCNWCAVQPESFFDATEYTCCEVYPGFIDLRKPGYIHPSGPATMAYWLAYTRAQHAGAVKPPVQGYVYGGTINFNIDLDVELECRSIVAMGGLVCGAGYREGYVKAFEAVRTMEPFLTDTRPLPHAAIVASQDSCNTQHDPDGVGEAYFEDIMGAFHALLDSRIPVQFAGGRDLCAGLPRDQPVLILSDTGYLTADQSEAIRAYVRNGGGLIATAQSSRIGEDGKPLDDFLLADVFGVHAAAAPDWKTERLFNLHACRGALVFDRGRPWWGDAAQAVTGPELAEHFAPRPWLDNGNGHVLTSPFQTVRKAAGARVRATIHSLTSPQSKPLPGIVEHRYGAGRVLYIAARIGEMYARYPYETWRRLLVEAVRRVAPRPPPVEVRAPRCVMLQAWEQAGSGRWILHLINDLDETGRPRGRTGQGANDQSGSRPRSRVIPIHNIEVTVRKPGATTVRQPLENREIRPRPIRDGLRFRIRELGMHTMIVVE